MDFLKTSLLCCLIAVLALGSSPPSSPEGAGVAMAVDRIERPKSDEVHFWLKVSNETDRPVYTGGHHLAPEPVLMLVFLEQWRQKEGWRLVAPCMDTPPPDVVKLNPGEARNLKKTLKLPLSAVCKERSIQLEGKFRVRLEYFNCEREARAYIEKLPSRVEELEVRPLSAVSEAFEVPPSPDPDH